MKPYKKACVQYRNRFFFWIRRFLPKTYRLTAYNHGTPVKVELIPNIIYNALHWRHVRPDFILEAIVFKLFVSK